MENFIFCAVKFAEIAVLFFCEISGNAPGFCLVLSEHIHNPGKHLFFVKSSILYVSLCSECVSDYPEAFSIIIT